MLVVPTLAGCVYGDPSADYTASLTNGCDATVSVDFSDSSVYNAENMVGEDLELADARWDYLEPGETDSMHPAAGQDAAFRAIVFSDTESRIIYWGADVNGLNDYTLSGDDCLPAVTQQSR